MKQLFLRDKDKQQLQQLLTQYLPTVWAYGSRVNGDAHEASKYHSGNALNVCHIKSLSLCFNLQKKLSIK
ncbi:MAG: hypothetical protein PHP00_01735 [Thiotrichaceae bacterium]|nr:hypothetical protein [Thiotrichaceae bacterium]